MLDFLRNLAILAVLGLVLFIVAPEQMRQVFGPFNGLGILPAFLVMVVLAALPKKSRRKRR